MVVKAEKSTVLVVDDEQPIRDTFQMMFDVLGMQCDFATSGDEALLRVTDNPSQYHAIFLDLYMPGIDGLETFDRIQKISPNLPIFIVSGYGQGELTDRLLGKGAAGILPKPFRLSEIQDIMGTLPK